MTHRSDLINTGFVAITPSNTTELDLRGLICGGAGNVVVTDGYGNDTTIPMIAGQTITGQIRYVKAATTATNLIGLRP